ncbi:hypothetical protein LOC51_21145 [Rubrivivax sp. JA1024]|nr:hypothetical protein [Rubrivivax sp. JA1024]
MKSCLLVGCGAEIGSNLLLQNDPALDGFAITSVITNSPTVDKHYPDLQPIHGIVARLALAQPGALSGIEVVRNDVLRINGRDVQFHFFDIRESETGLSDHFDISILATSKNDISDASAVARKLHRLASVILGVAEANDLPSIYSCLSDLSMQDIPTIDRKVIDRGMYCLGSCQTNGMHASLRIIIESLREIGLRASNILAIETDIIHPDTPNGVLGTRSFEGRTQDARENLRPSFSQIAQSQLKVMPWAPLTNTVSLRVPIHAPGYQINRFVVKDDGRLTEQAIKRAIDSIHARFDRIAKAASIPLGSRAYSNDRRCATILTDPHHLIISRPPHLIGQGLSEIIVQSFVNNTVGYSSLVIAVAKAIAAGTPLATFGRL